MRVSPNTIIRVCACVGCCKSKAAFISDIVLFAEKNPLFFYISFQLDRARALFCYETAAVCAHVMA